MANLIITVIAIALVAVAALMGAYYGGTAFIDGQAKAQANQLVEASKQIATAWQLYANDRGGDYTITDANWADGTASDLVPKYLATLPRFDFAASCFSYPYPLKITAGGTLANNVTDSNFIQFCYIPKKVCEQVNMMANGSTIIPTDATYAQIFALAKPFYCTYFTSSTAYYMQYRVF